MKKSLAIALAGCLLICSNALAGKQDFKLINRTGFDIAEVYVSAHHADDWESDVMGKAVLATGATVEIHFVPSDKTKEWDLKVVDGKGKAIVWENLDLSEISKVTLHYTDGKATADIE